MALEWMLDSAAKARPARARNSPWRTPDDEPDDQTWAPLGSPTTPEELGDLERRAYEHDIAQAAKVVAGWVAGVGGDAALLRDLLGALGLLKDLREVS